MAKKLQQAKLNFFATETDEAATTETLEARIGERTVHSLPSELRLRADIREPVSNMTTEADHSTVALTYRQAIVEQIVRDEQAIRSCEVTPECPGEEFFEARINAYREELMRIDAEGSK